MFEEYDSRDDCSGILTEIKQSGVKSVTTVINFSGIPHEIWTNVNYLRIPLLLAFYHQLIVHVHSPSCYRPNYQFNVATFKKQGQFERKLCDL